MTACCQRKEPRARSGSHTLAVCRSCRRSSRNCCRIVNVIKLKKRTIEITTIRTCKNGPTVSQSRNGCNAAACRCIIQFVMELELSEQCVTRLFASSSALRCIAPTIDEGHLRGNLCSEAKSADLPQTIILKENAII